MSFTVQGKSSENIVEPLLRKQQHICNNEANDHLNQPTQIINIKRSCLIIMSIVDYYYIYAFTAWANMLLGNAQESSTCI